LFCLGGSRRSGPEGPRRGLLARRPVAAIISLLLVAGLAGGSGAQSGNHPGGSKERGVPIRRRSSEQSVADGISIPIVFFLCPRGLLSIVAGGSPWFKYCQARPFWGGTRETGFDQMCSRLRPGWPEVGAQGRPFFAKVFSRLAHQARADIGRDFFNSDRRSPGPK